MQPIPDHLRLYMDVASKLWPMTDAPVVDPDAPTIPDLPQVPDEAAPPTWADQPTLALFYCKRCKTALTPNPLCTACRNELAERYAVEF